MPLNWLGDQVIRRMLGAQKKGVDSVMADCVLYSKRNHPGWQNRTATAEGSVRIQKFAAKLSGGDVGGVWGSVDVNYVIWLEIIHGSFLRNSATVNYPKLAAKIHGFFK